MHASVLLLTGEVLPRLVGLPEVHGSLQNPQVRPRRVGEFDQHVCHVEELQRHRRRRNADEKHFDLVWTVDGETAGLTLKQEKTRKNTKGKKQTTRLKGGKRRRRSLLPGLCVSVSAV